MRGDRLKELRKSKKISQLKLAEVLGVDRTMIGKYELKNHQPSNEILEKMADYLEVSPAYLMGYDECINKPSNEKYSTIEKDIIDKFRKLNNDAKKRVLRNLDNEYFDMLEETKPKLDMKEIS